MVHTCIRWNYRSFESRPKRAPNFLSGWGAGYLSGFDDPERVWWQFSNDSITPFENSVNFMYAMFLTTILCARWDNLLHTVLPQGATTKRWSLPWITYPSRREYKTWGQYHCFWDWFFVLFVWPRSLLSRHIVVYGKPISAATFFPKKNRMGCCSWQRKETGRCVVKTARLFLAHRSTSIHEWMLRQNVDTHVIWWLADRPKRPYCCQITHRGKKHRI
jgi:hypothetical protein